MKKILLAMILIGLFSAVCFAQTWDKKQSEVWNVVLESYKDIDNADPKWTEKWVTKDALVWGNTTPMPRGRNSVTRWNNYQFPQSKTMISEYSPTGIVVHDSTAVAHYYYSNGAKNTEGKHKTTHGRCTDVLVKDEKSWKFVSWHCADQKDDD